MDDLYDEYVFEGLEPAFSKLKSAVGLEISLGRQKNQKKNYNMVSMVKLITTSTMNRRMRMRRPQMISS